MVRRNTIGDRIRALREAKGLTQAELAKEMFVKRETIVQWETNTRDLKTVSTVKLADFFGATCDEILRGVKAENLGTQKMTGLSDEAIDALMRLKGTKVSDAINLMLENEDKYKSFETIAYCFYCAGRADLFVSATNYLNGGINTDTINRLALAKGSDFLILELVKDAIKSIRVEQNASKD
jgi:transcriptional regulator with XRE-family HTH domain